MQEPIQINLIHGKKGVKIEAYYAATVPRTGEYIDLATEELTGLFLVEKVIHRVFDSGRGVLGYVRVYLTDLGE